jgi:hypothetical protein
MSRREDIRLVAETLVTTLSAMLLALVVLSWAAQHPRAWKWIGDLQHIPAHEPCWFCGMSRAFVAIWKLDLNTAVALNPNSPWLFSVVLGGSTIGPVYWTAKLRRHRCSRT